MTKFNDRIQAIARIEGLSINEMERIASKGVLSRAIKNDTDIQAKWVFALCENFTKFSPEWLLTGKGEPLCKREPVNTRPAAPARSHFRGRAQMVAAPPSGHPATPHISPLSCALRLVQPTMPPTQKEPPGAPFFAVMPSGSMPSSWRSSGGSVLMPRSHHFAQPIKPN